MKRPSAIFVALLLLLMYMFGYWQAIVMPTVRPMAPSSHDEYKHLDRGCDNRLNYEDGSFICDVQVSHDEDVYIIKVNKEL